MCNCPQTCVLQDKGPRYALRRTTGSRPTLLSYAPPALARTSLQKCFKLLVWIRGVRLCSWRKAQLATVLHMVCRLQST